MELESTTYRQNIANVKAHTFYLSKKGLKNQVYHQLEKDGVAVTDSKDKIDKIIRKYFESLKQAFTGKTYGVIIHSMKVTAVSFKVTISPELDHKKKYTITHRDSFNLLHALIFNSKQVLNSSMTKLYTDQGKNFNKSAFLDIGHDKKHSVWDSRVSDELLKYGERPTGAQLDVKEVAALFKLVKDDSKDSVHVSLESSNKNRKEGATTIKAKRTKLLKDLKIAVKKLDLANVDGSDSLKVKKDKQLLISTLKPFNNKKNIKTSKIPKLDPSKKDPKTKKKRRKISAKNMGITALSAKRSKAKASPTSSILRMIAMINKELPDTVRKNMQAPALVNRSGRFAESVKVTEVAQTTKGFPSVGYTYQRNPYQVFETGSRGAWSSPERDPRKLIDKSIREIAAEMAIGRFYTRRV